MKNLLIVLLLSLLISSCALKKSTETVPPPETVEKVPVPEPKYLWAFLPGVNVRQAGRENAEKLTLLADGDSVAVIGNQNGWYQIRTGNRTEGWVRSDLLGPKNFSTFNKAVAFVDSLREKNGTEVYFDKNLYHKRIYIKFPAAYYQSRSRIDQEAQILLRTFQHQVYRGNVTARVLKTGSEDEYLTLESKGEVNADPLLPVVPFGTIRAAQRGYADGIALTYEAPLEIDDQNLLKTARALSASYPLTYKKIRISFISQDGNGREICRLYFIEDSSGEEYRFNECE